MYGIHSDAKVYAQTEAHINSYAKQDSPQSDARQVKRESLATEHLVNNQNTRHIARRTRHQQNKSSPWSNSLEHQSSSDGYAARST